LRLTFLPIGKSTFKLHRNIHPFPLNRIFRSLFVTPRYALHHIICSETARQNRAKTQSYSGQYKMHDIETFIVMAALAIALFIPAITVYQRSGRKLLAAVALVLT
jgi:hypothetical protein